MVAEITEPARAVRGADLANRLTDAEALAFLLKGLRPSIVAAIGQAISKKFGALRVCLEQQEQLLASFPDSPEKEAMIRGVIVARVLCKNIAMDVNAETENLRLDEAALQVDGHPA